MSSRYGQAYRNGGSGGSGGSGGGGGGYGNLDRKDEDYDPYGEGYGSDRYAPPPRRTNPRPPPSARNAGPPPRSAQRAVQETNAEREMGKVLELIKQEWPAMCENDCIPVQLALQLLDDSSVGRAHEYRNFQRTHQYLQESLKKIVHEYHQGFNSSIGTFHKIQGSIQTSQKKVRALKESLAGSKTALCATDPELKKLHATSHMYDGVLQTLNELDDLRTVPDQLEARISEKRFLTAVEVLQNALRKLTKPELDDIGALGELRNYLANQETALMDILVEELHEHLYLKSPYCQERWQNLAKSQGALGEAFKDAPVVSPFHSVLDTIDWDRSVTEDPHKNPEADTFYYVTLLVESLNRLGRLETAVDMLKQRLPVELFSVVNETINDIDQKYPSSLRGGSHGSHGLHIYGQRETRMRADVIYDLLWSLYGKFEAIAEGHRVFHESIKALIRREGAGNNIALLGSFKELWNLYQNEIRSLLHHYVTTDADVYQFRSSPGFGMGINGAQDAARANLFKFSEVDSKSVEMATEYEALDGIIQAAVPGLTSDSRKGGDGKKGLVVPRSDRASSRKSTAGYGSNNQGSNAHKSLVEPSVFNMSLLLPPTLVFLQRLKNIVPPGSDLATSTLTSFLDNFLVNVFQPQLDETLGKLSDTVFGEADAFFQDSEWARVAKRPVFKGATAFFTIVTAFCRMLGTIPHDQALSALIITQMLRYYDRCFNWYKALVTKTPEEASSTQELRASAVMALEPGVIHDMMKKIWDAGETVDAELLVKEVDLLMAHANEKHLEHSDIIQDRDTISSLCLLYTSMKWLSVKIQGLRHITKNETDSSRSAALPKPEKKRWTLLNDPNKAAAEEGPVYLPMTQETVQSFDSILTSYTSLATTSLLTLHSEIRCRILQSLHTALSPSQTAPYLLDQDVAEPDPQILSLNAEMVAFDETASRYLRAPEVRFLRTGLGLLINAYLVRNAPMTAPMNARGCGRMRLNVLVLQQNLKNVEEGPGAELRRAREYFELFAAGPDGVVNKAKEDAEADRKATNGGVAGNDGGVRFTYDELKALLELWYSEQLADPERGVAAAAKRQLADKLLGLSEHMWQS
ncbi:Sec8 exocyst complex component-specific domain-containing protein [Dichotomopilus funicola]|uniref:Exocyst complex component Sec8 n=1 Tax=Dichotomopilus funicola TaxID=1934379 RepID=A0AAN6VCP3_9PEZI|nr:Sec8 exocyst complex component-specific domain-containing protein [Dichotomopilus funicola]